MKLVKGENLTPAQRDEVLAAFIYRRENTVIYPVKSKMVDPSQYRTLCDNLDPVWVNAHAFFIRNDGHLAECPKHCEPYYMADDYVAVDPDASD